MWSINTPCWSHGTQLNVVKIRSGVLPEFDNDALGHVTASGVKGPGFRALCEQVRIKQ